MLVGKLLCQGVKVSCLWERLDYGLRIAWLWGYDSCDRSQVLAAVEPEAEGKLAHQVVATRGLELLSSALAGGGI